VARKLLCSSAFGILFALALLFGAGAFSPDEARALDPATKPKYFDPATRKEADILRKIVEQSYGPDEAKKSTARKILTRQASRSAPRLLPAIAARTGLVGAAAGVWTVVGLEFYYLPCWECDSESLTLSSEWKVSEGAISYEHRTTSPSESRGLLTYYGASRDSAGNVSMDVVFLRDIGTIHTTTNSGGKTWYFSFPAVNVANHLGGNQGFTVTTPADQVLPPPYPAYFRWSKDTLDSREIVLNIVHRPVASEPSVSSGTQLCQPSNGPCVGDVAPPVFDGGRFSEGDAPSDSLRMTAQESNDFINSVVADPATPEVIPEEDLPLAPEPDPDWDPNTDPFSPLFDPFSDPEGDPDGDGVPNRDDPDPEGDEDPDGDGDPNEHPRPVPYGPTDDPEGDGDPDADGDPDETSVLAAT